MDTVNIAEQIGRATNSQIKSMICRRLETIYKADKAADGLDWTSPDRYETEAEIQKCLKVRVEFEEAEAWLYEAVRYVSESMWDSIVEQYLGAPIINSPYCYFHLTH